RLFELAVAAPAPLSPEGDGRVCDRLRCGHLTPRPPDRRGRGGEEHAFVLPAEALRHRAGPSTGPGAPKRARDPAIQSFFSRRGSMTSGRSGFWPGFAFMSSSSSGRSRIFSASLCLVSSDMSFCYPDTVTPIL